MGRKSTRGVARLCALAAIAALGCGTADQEGSTSEPAVVYGSSGELGEGTARTYAEFDAEGNPVAIGLTFDEGYLRGLPAELNPESMCFDLNGDGVTTVADGECLGNYSTDYDFPAALTERDDVPFRWAAVGLEPMGHHPEGVWDTPHLDVHFYIQPREEAHAIRPGSCGILIDCEDFERATEPLPAEYLPEGYVDVEAAVGRMGNHLIDTGAPEFEDGPFTGSLVYGAYDGHVTFIEPMLAIEYLESQPNECKPIKQPAAWEQSGYYPSEYCVRYSPDEGVYRVSLEGLTYY